MPANLPLLLRGPSDAPASTGGFIAFHPRYRAWLLRAGIDSAAAALALQGEVVCGHPDRHVVRCVVRGRVIFLKREHVVRWKVRVRNRRAGFGPVSRAEREAETLKSLEIAGLPGPQWLAYGEAADGRAFLLVDELERAADLRAALADTGLSLPDRRLLAERAGRAIAELHEAGFGTPELSAKHLFVAAGSGAVTLLDWQSAPKPGSVPDRARAEQIAGLDASLADGLATPAERRRFLWAYLRVVRRNRRNRSDTPRYGAFARSVADHAGRFRDRSSHRDQRQHAAGGQRLVWLAGEEVCAIPSVAAVWPTPANGSPFYPEPGEPIGPEEWVTLPDGRRGLLTRFATVAPLGRWWADVRGKPWRSPAARLARLLFHLDRYGVPGPRLLAFGQRLESPVARSFLLSEPRPGSAPLALPPASPERRRLLRGCGELLRKLHDAGVRLSGSEPPFSVGPDGSVGVDAPASVRLAGRVGELGRRLDLHRLTTRFLPGLPRTDRLRVVRGYAGTPARGAK